MVKRLQSSAFIFASVLGIAFLSPVKDARAEELNRKGNPVEGFFSIDLENDIHVGTDLHYTSGVRFSFTSPEDKAWFGLEEIAPILPFVHEGDGIRSYHSLGHYIFTPDNLALVNPDPTDRPYAGWLNLETGIIAYDTDHIDMWVLGLGVTGDPSLGRWGQERIHALTGSIDPQGWDSQVPAEPTVQLTYNRVWFGRQFDLWEGVKMDFQPRVSASVGNAFVYADIGLMGRIGSKLEKDLGPTRNQPGFVGADYFTPTDGIEWYVFGGFQARGIAHNLFLDGGLFRDFDATVRREPLVADIQTGVVFTFGSWRLSGFNTFRTKEFSGQRELDVFGGVQLTFQY